MSHLFEPITLKNLTCKNRVVMSPMCQYSVEAKDGFPTEWHFVHYVSRAVGGVGLIIIESTGVTPDGRISDLDLGLWSDDQVAAFKRIVDEVHGYGTKIGIQLNHAGRKAQDVPHPLGPSTHAVDGGESAHAMTQEEIDDTVKAFGSAAARAMAAGFDTIEVHGAHGYLIHQFMSPAINTRTDAYGSDRARFGTEVIRAVRDELPDDMPLLMRVSAIEYIDGGYGLDHSLSLAERFKQAGIDAFDVSSGGEAEPGRKKPGNYPGYQVPFARAFRRRLQLPVMSVGMLESPHLAESVVANGDADFISIGRGLLHDPYWAYHAQETLDGSVSDFTKPYERAFNRHHYPIR